MCSRTLFSIAIWLVATLGGFGGLWVHSFQPGKGFGTETINSLDSRTLTGIHPSQTNLRKWLSGHIQPPASTAKIILMFIHPKCPCTMASLAEFERILARTSPTVSAHVSVFVPPNSGKGWLESRAIRYAREIPKTTIHYGINCFPEMGVHTSGQVLILDDQFKLLFQGGITEARGHEGGSYSANAVSRILADIPESTKESPVFGCSMEQSAKSETP